MTTVMTQKQLNSLRRLLNLVGHELQTMATSDKLPDQWGELNLTSYTLQAMAAVWNQLVDDKIIPPRG